MPVVTMEGVVAERMVVLSVVSKHLSLVPGDTDAVLTIVDGRAALKVAGERALAWKKGELDLGGLLENYTDADRKKAVLDFMGVLVSAKQEPAEYRESLNEEKTQQMVQMVDDLRKEESLAAVLAGVEEIATMWGPRGYTAKNRSDGGERETCCVSVNISCCVYFCCPRNLVASHTPPVGDRESSWRHNRPPFCRTLAVCTYACDRS